MDINNSNKRYKVDTSSSYNDILFFKLWRNIVINRVIFKYSALYKKNETVKLFSLKSLKSYKEREYITTLEYKCSEETLFTKGDLPEYGALEEINLIYSLSSITSDAIPEGVEYIFFSNRNCEIVLSELPSSIVKLSNVLLSKPYIDNHIPANITSISFNHRMDPIQFYDIIIPNTIKQLNFCGSLFNSDHGFPISIPPPSPSFIPSSVVDLTTFYDERYKSNLPIIPSTVTKLWYFIARGNCIIEKGFIPFGIRNLTINAFMDQNSSLHFTEGSLPESITKLCVVCHIYNNLGVQEIFSKNSIPNSVNNLEIDIKDCSDINSLVGILPKSLIRLNILSEKGVDKIRNELPSFILSELPLIKHLKVCGKVINLKNKNNTKIKKS